MSYKMTAVKNYILENIVSIIFSAYLLIFTSLVVYFNNLSALDGIVFLFFQLGAVLLPGIGIVLLLCKNTSLSGLELFIYSYASGYILNIIIYFLFVPFQLQKAVLPALIFIDVLSIYMIKKSNIKSYSPSKADLSIWNIFIVIILCITFVVYCGNNLLPTVLAENAYYTDLLFWIGDTIELAHGFPPRHFRNIEQSYFYHYFSSIQMAVMHIITRINVAELGLVFAPFQSVILLVSSAYLLFKEVVKTKIIFFTSIGMGILLLTTGNEARTAANYVSHMYKAPFGFEIAIAFGMLSLYFIIRQFSQTHWHKYYFVMTTLCYAVCLGAKGPSGSIVLGILGILILNYFFVKKQYKVAFLYGSVLLLVFIVLFYFILLSDNNSVASTLNAEASRRLANNGFSGAFFEKMYYGGTPWFLARGMQVIHFAFHSQYTISIIFFTGILLKIIDYKKIDCVDVACVVMSFVGCILTLCLSHPTFSQLYFIMATYPYAALFGIKSFSEFEPAFVSKNSTLKKSIFIVQIIIIITSTVIGLNSFFSSYYFKLGWNIGIGNYQDNSAPIMEVSKTPLYNYVSSEDYEAYVWIRENTNWEELFTSNLCLDAEIVRPYCLGAFSERHILMNDIPLIERLMNNDKNALEKITEKMGIDYIVQYKQISPEFDAKGLDLECVFDNNSIAIFKTK